MPSSNARAIEPTKEELHKIYAYDEKLGCLRWKTSRRSATKVGDIAGGIKGSGYGQLWFKGKVYGIHRLVWIYHFGAIPKGKTPDHINRVKNDNRISNLRLLTDAEQVYAKLARGFLWSKGDNRWTARITKDRKRVHLGNFKSALLARLAYEQATVKRHPNINHTQFLDAINHLLEEGTPVSQKLVTWLSSK